MNRERRTRIIAVICILTGILYCGKKCLDYFTKSSYMEQWDRDFYMVVASRMNQVSSSSYDLAEGDVVTVNVACSSGMFDVAIFDESKEAVYFCSDCENIFETVEIPADGQYSLAINGKKAAGTVIFRINPED